MPRTVNFHDAHAQLSALLDEVASGEEVIIAKNGIPQARLVPVALKRKRRSPHNALDVTFLADDFDASDAEAERLFDEA